MRGSDEYRQPPRGGLSLYAARLLPVQDNCGLVLALLEQPRSVAGCALLACGLEGTLLRTRLHSLVGAGEPWLVEKALAKARREGYPLGSDHLLEVTWDEDAAAGLVLQELVTAEKLEAALNWARYPDDFDAPAVPAVLPLSPSPLSDAI